MYKLLMCIIIGDSIAVGIADASHHCTKKAHKGWTSTQWDNHYVKPITDGLVVISLGTNDTKYSQTLEHLTAIRSRITSRQVIWILPHATNPAGHLPVSKVQGWVRQLAEKHGDRVIVTKAHADRYHPTGREYRRLAREIQK